MDALRPYFDLAYPSIARHEVLPPLNDDIRAAVAVDWLRRKEPDVSALHCHVMGALGICQAITRLRRILAGDHGVLEWCTAGPVGRHKRLALRGHAGCALARLKDSASMPVLLAGVDGSRTGLRPRLVHDRTRGSR